MKNKLFKVTASLIALTSALLPLSACGNSEFIDLTQRTVTELNYVGVREDLTIVSNVYEEVDLTTLGLKANAYFLFGDRDNMYFGVQNSFSFGNDTWGNDVSQGKVEVMKYNFANGTLTQCSSLNPADRVAMIDSDTFIYFTYERTGMLGYYKYHYRITELNAKGEVKQTRTEEFDGKKDTFEKEMYQYVSSRRDYWWGNDPGFKQQVIVGPPQGKPSSSVFIYAPVLWGFNDYYNPYDIEKSEDKIWNFIGGLSYSYETLYLATDNNYVAICDKYYESQFLSSTCHNVYFAYELGGDVHYLFSEPDNNNEAIGLYVI